MAEIPYSRSAMAEICTFRPYILNQHFSILSSKAFRFLVGPHRKEFTLHSAPVARQSQVLDVLLNGPMREATEGATTWEYVDEKTFIRFGQYVYTGNYEGESPLEPEGKESEVQKEVEQPADEDFWGFNTVPKRNKKKKAVFADEPAMQLATKREQAWHKFENERSYNYGAAGIHFSSKNTDRRVQYKEVFLAHARLHMLAGYYEMEQLEQLTLHKLHRTLCGFELHNERVCDIVDLLRYCFEGDERVDLRGLVAGYAVCHFEKLWENVAFQQLFRAYPDLSIAVLESMLARLTNCL